MKRKITKAIFPVAGQGTRFLLLAKDRYVAGKIPIPIIAVSQLCITLSRAPMTYFADIYYRSKMIAMPNCAEGCAGSITSPCRSTQMIRPSQPRNCAHASASS